MIQTPQTDIQAFLYSELNIEIFEELTENGDYDGLFEPLEFFNFLYSEFEFYYDNDENYLNIKNHFKKLPFENDQQNYFFIWYLKEVIEELHISDTPNTIQNKCFEIISNLFDKIHIELNPNKESETAVNRYDFNAVKKYIATLPNDKEKINYLIVQKTDYLQNNNDGYLEGWGDTPFDRKCTLEITKLKELLKTNTPQQSKSNTQQNIQNTLNWQGTPLEFTELIKALLLTKKISPELSQKEVFNRLKEFFNVDAFNESDKLKDIRKRINTPTPFINTLETSLDNWIKSKD